MISFKEQREHLLANLEAVKAIIAVGSASETVVDSTVTILASVVDTLKEIQGRSVRKEQAKGRTQTISASDVFSPVTTAPAGSMKNTSPPGGVGSMAPSSSGSQSRAASTGLGTKISSLPGKVPAGTSFASVAAFGRPGASARPSTGAEPAKVESSFGAIEETMVRGSITKNELLEMGVSLSTIREWTESGSLRKAGKFGIFLYNEELRILINRYLQAKKGKEEFQGAESDHSTESILRKELVDMGISKSTIGFWLRSGKLTKTDDKGTYLYNQSVADLIEKYLQRRTGEEIPKADVKREGRISRRELLRKGVSASAIGFWIREGKLHKSGEKGFYLYDTKVQDLLDSYRPKRKR